MKEEGVLVQRRLEDTEPWRAYRFERRVLRCCLILLLPFCAASVWAINAWTKGDKVPPRPSNEPSGAIVVPSQIVFEPLPRTGLWS